MHFSQLCTALCCNRACVRPCRRKNYELMCAGYVHVHSVPAVMFLLPHGALAQPSFVLARRCAAPYAEEVALLTASGFVLCVRICFPFVGNTCAHHHKPGGRCS